MNTELLDSLNVGDFIVNPNYKDLFACIVRKGSRNTYAFWGFGLNNSFVKPTSPIIYAVMEGDRKATSEEINKRLVDYAEKLYPKGSAFKCLILNSYSTCLSDTFFNAASHCVYLYNTHGVVAKAFSPETGWAELKEAVAENNPVPVQTSEVVFTIMDKGRPYRIMCDKTGKIATFGAYRTSLDELCNFTLQIKNLTLFNESVELVYLKKRFIKVLGFEMSLKDIEQIINLLK